MYCNLLSKNLYGGMGKVYYKKNEILNLKNVLKIEDFFLPIVDFHRLLQHKRGIV